MTNKTNEQNLITENNEDVTSSKKEWWQDIDWQDKASSMVSHIISPL